VVKRPARPQLPPGFGTIWSTVALDLVGFGLVFPVLPIYAKRFHVSAAGATGLVAIFAAATFVFSPVWGRLSDRIGRKPVLLISLAGTCIGSLLTGVAGGIGLLYVGRLVDGISGASVSVAQASVGDVASPAERPRLFGLLGAAFGVGFVIGPALGALAKVWGPRVPFYLAAVLAGVNVLIAWRRLPETHPAGSSTSREKRSINPLAPLARVEGIAPLVGVAFFAWLSFSAFEATFALFGQRRLGFDVGSSAAVFAVIGLVIVAVQAGLVHPVAKRLGESGTLRAGLVANVLGLLLLAIAHSWSEVVPALLALTVGQGLVQTTMSSTLAGRVGPDQRAGVLGAQQSAGGLARAIGPLGGGLLLGHAGLGSPYVAGAAGMAGGLLLFNSSRLSGTGRWLGPRAGTRTGHSAHSHVNP
jgi:DHA1 family tetracycline resistance protein-like MFS transporter